MKRKDENIDELIHQALNKEEAEFYNKLDEQNVFEQALGLFQGKLKWLTIAMIIVTFIAMGLAVYSLIEFLNAEDVVSMLKWGAALFYLIILIVMIKLYGWMQMDKNAIMRELKRLELQISLLASKLKD